MLTVEDYAKIRWAHRDGMSIREIARRFHHSRRKIREVLQEPEPKGYTRRQPAAAPKLDRVKPIIDQILAEDEEAPRKQRHTAAEIYRRLVAEQEYRGGYDQVRRYVARRHRQRRGDVHSAGTCPGQRAECDFGHIWVDFPQGRRQVAVLLVTWAYSYCPFAVAVPTERTEAILYGMVEALSFFGAVPRELWWDNPTTIATTILRGPPARVQHPLSGPGQPLRIPALVLHAGAGATRSRSWRIGCGISSGAGLLRSPRWPIWRG